MMVEAVKMLEPPFEILELAHWRWTVVLLAGLVSLTGWRSAGRTSRFSACL